jgi:NAD(P)-dependent dehydrogenase (short-subunit alcohol dehydrogenase family)
VVTGSQQPVGQAIIQELAGVYSISFLSAAPCSAVLEQEQDHIYLNPEANLLFLPPAHGAACIYACDADPAYDYEPLLGLLSRDSPNTKLIPYPFPIAAEDATLALIDDILNAFGRLDIWVCSSGLLGPASIEATKPSDLQKCFEANSMAPFFALKYAPPAMAKLTKKQAYPNAAPKDQKYGSIIVVSSVAATYGGCWGPCYTMSSHAALGVVRAGVAVLKGWLDCMF